MHSQGADGKPLPIHAGAQTLEELPVGKTEADGLENDFQPSLTVFCMGCTVNQSNPP